MPTVSVIIVNWNGHSYLGELLASLERQERAADEVIVVDNASSDDSVNFVRERFPWVRLVTLEENTGFTGGNNRGYTEARGEWIALLNSDTVVDPRWLLELIAALESHPEAGVAVPKILLAGANSNQTIDCAGAMYNNLGFAWGRGSNQPDVGQFEAPEEVPGGTACSMLLRRDVLEGEPLFDDSFFMYYEEADLTLRVRGRGHTILYVPSAIVYHKRSQAMSASGAPRLRQQFYGNRNRVKILAKYYPLSVLLGSLHLILLSLLYWNLFLLFRGGPGMFLRSLSAQLRYAIAGFRERGLASNVEASRWLPSMSRHGLLSLLRLSRDLGSYSQ